MRSAKTNFLQLSRAKRPGLLKAEAHLSYAVRLVHRVCCLAGSASLIDDLQSEDGASGLRSIIARHDNAALYDWLVDAISYQGISDRVAYAYMEQHGRLTWADIQDGVAEPPACPKLRSYWHFYGCRFDKLSRTCSQPDEIRRCPLPRHDLRNGRLNQTAYSLYLFVRDLTDGDLIGWIDQRLLTAAGEETTTEHVQSALIEPLRHVYGVSDKVLCMALSCILLSAPNDRSHWVVAGAGMIAIDTLVHNFLHRTGILNRLGSTHAYGAGCYSDTGCAAIIEAIAERIDAREFNSRFPRQFPRFVQHAIWQYCAQQGLNVCNGNRINDRRVCDNIYCHLFSICDRIELSKANVKSHKYSKNKYSAIA
jgi:hypothetical protein